MVRRRVYCLRYPSTTLPDTHEEKTKFFFISSEQSPKRYTDETAQTLIDTGFEPYLLRKLRLIELASHSGRYQIKLNCPLPRKKQKRGCRTKTISCGSLSNRIFLIKLKGAVASSIAAAPSISFVSVNFKSALCRSSGRRRHYLPHVFRSSDILLPVHQRLAVPVPAG